MDDKTEEILNGGAKNGGKSYLGGYCIFHDALAKKNWLKYNYIDPFKKGELEKEIRIVFLPRFMM